jgi:tetratricopeptide (TPR) repeat protein
MANGKQMSGQIFISYRREESRWSARSLHDRLAVSFDPKQIFMDIDAIALGEDFVKAIETTVAKCDVLVAVIGANWLTSKDDQGDRRLDNPEDFVRMEIATALSRDIRVIPVLVDGALMPRSTELPDDLKPLVRRNALQISDTSFDGDCQRLVAAINQVLEKATAEEQEREKNRLDAESREHEEEQRREPDSADSQRRENERLLNQPRNKDQLDAERLEPERRRRLEAERFKHEEKERLEAEQRQREGASNGKTVPRSPALTPGSGPAQAEMPPLMQSQVSAMRKPFALRAPVVVVVLLLIVGVIWFAGSKLNHIERKAASGTPIPAPTPSLVSSDPSFYNNRGWDFYQKKDYDKATSDFNDAIRLDPNFALAYFNRGITYGDKKEYDKAISDFNDAIRLDPNFALAYFNRGIAYDDKKEYDKAISDYNDAIRLNPNSALAYGNRGNAYAGKKEYDKAISDYQDAIRLDPNYSLVYINRGIAYVGKKEDDKAISDFNDAIRLDPNSALAYNNRGSFYYGKKEYDQAISDYTDAIRLNPNYALAYYNRGLVYREQGNNAQAQADFDRAKKLGYPPNLR